MGTYVPFMIIVREEGGLEDPVAWAAAKKYTEKGGVDERTLAAVERVDGPH